MYPQMNSTAEELFLALVAIESEWRRGNRVAELSMVQRYDPDTNEHSVDIRVTCPVPRVPSHVAQQFRVRVRVVPADAATTASDSRTTTGH